MNWTLTEHWDEERWAQARVLYQQAFPSGAKPEQVIRRMFQRRMCELHVGTDDAGPAAMALTGLSKDKHALLIDYLAVREDLRGHGWGEHLVSRIKQRAADVQRAKGVIVEIEADDNETNARRLSFWRRCGFAATDYVHQYIWVPEPYRALVCSFDPLHPLPVDGRQLFRYINDFHHRAFSSR
ncbi:GNAT family N-acetyltransferase [Paenibacillus tarimensis]|uniref:GNAT family N-acetyltransferase n=1 Tax=Paenibacillus tarimensis TaxID=416012 RepID=UPI001F402E62|nr:GNAT family N-acetyltransferase [Paenibacillus tarimensis]MCF2942736.1 GNAT family N-acetyltransferase [Paenibacillus tarimensis]